MSAARKLGSNSRAPMAFIQIAPAGHILVVGGKSTVVFPAGTVGSSWTCAFLELVTRAHPSHRYEPAPCKSESHPRPSQATASFHRRRRASRSVQRASHGRDKPPWAAPARDVRPGRGRSSHGSLRSSNRGPNYSAVPVSKGTPFTAPPNYARPVGVGRSAGAGLSGISKR